MERLRTVRFSPYRKGMGPTFTLTTYDAGERSEGAMCRRSYLGYRLVQVEHAGPPPWSKPPARTVLFDGADIGLSPGTAIDSDESICAVMGWLTLRPGDTDSDFFANYTPAQLEFCEQHAEALSLEVMNRFGED